jgi:hypothetical protein
MDQISLLNNLISYANDIDAGRKGLAADGMEHEGYLNFNRGISGALTAFKESGAAADPQTLILAELAFLQQELQFCGETAKATRTSLTRAIQEFNDALLAGEAVHDKSYIITEKTFQHSPKQRYQGFPKDSFHLACISHRTRIQNILKVPGMNLSERAVYDQRLANMTIAQNRYLALQKKAFGISNR